MHLWIGNASEERTSPHSQSETEERKSSRLTPGLMAASMVCIIAPSDGGAVRGWLKTGMSVDGSAVLGVKKEMRHEGCYIRTKGAPNMCSSSSWLL
jgi:hypothetical protein